MKKVFFLCKQNKQRFAPRGHTNDRSHQTFVRVGVGLVKYQTNVRIWDRAPTRI